MGLMVTIRGFMYLLSLRNKNKSKVVGVFSDMRQVNDFIEVYCGDRYILHCSNGVKGNKLLTGHVPELFTDKFLILEEFETINCQWFCGELV